MGTDQFIFLILVFGAVFMLATAVAVPTFGADAQAARRLKARMNSMMNAMDPASVSLLRERYLRDLSPLERMLERLPGMPRLAQLLEQAGRSTLRAYRFALMTAGAAVAAGAVTWLLTAMPMAGAVAVLFVAVGSLTWLRWQRAKRLARFEEQLPEALDTMARALRAGHPFVGTLRMVGEEMGDPLGREFQTTFTDLNYGMDTKTAFVAMLRRMPSMSLVTVVTAVHVQHDTGGNLAEIMDKIAAMVRSRFRFQRKVKTLSAEGRMSAWVLTLVPFVLAAVIAVTTPDYLPMLIKDPMGRMLILGAVVAMAIGLLWIRRIIRFDI